MNDSTLPDFNQDLPDNIMRQINDVLDGMDFHKVFYMMQILNWKWINEKGKMEVPDEIRTLKKEAHARLREAYIGATHYGSKSYGSSSGGFNATYYEEVDGESPPIKRLCLEFILAESEV